MVAVLGVVIMSNRYWFSDRMRDRHWYDEQDNDDQWIKENSMQNKYIQVFEGFLNDNSEGIAKNAKAPRFRSSASGKSAIVTTQDIPAGSVITFGAWTGKGNYGHYIKLSGQLVVGESSPPIHPQQHVQSQSAPPQQQAPQQQDDPFDDDIPF